MAPISNGSLEYIAHFWCEAKTNLSSGDASEQIKIAYKTPHVQIVYQATI